MTTPTLPAGYVSCDECTGTGREVEIDEVLDDEGMEVIAEIPRDYGPCEICDGNGYLPDDTPADDTVARAAHQQAMDEHLRGGVHGSTHCPPGCPVELEMYKEHRRPGGVHETRCRPSGRCDY